MFFWLLEGAEEVIGRVVDRGDLAISRADPIDLANDAFNTPGKDR